MNPFFKKVIQRIKVKEGKLEFTHPINVSKIKSMLGFLCTEFGGLRNYIYKNEFKTEDDEIEFFKIVKPQVLSKLLFYNKVYRFEISAPSRNDELLQCYIKQKMKEISKEHIDFEQHEAFFHYYKSQRTDLDRNYFLREKINILNGLNSFVFECDSRFSTYYDFKLSLFLCNEAFNEYLLDRLKMTETENLQPQLKKMRWTASKSALVELLYALNASGSINDGNGKVSELISAFEIIFNIDLKGSYHVFHRIKTRGEKFVSFLDRLKISLDKYIDKE